MGGRRALVRIGVFAGLAVVPATMLVLALTVADGRGFDFHAFWDAGRAVLAGHSPYPDSLPASADRLTFRPFVYPAPAAFLMAPFAVLPLVAGSILFALVSVAAIALALRLLGVRDWRCYGAAFVSCPGVAAVGGGTVSPFLLLGAAALWRYRHRAAVAGTVFALLVVLKLFLWPLAAWLLALRRFGATAVAVAVATVSTVAAWALIGFAGLREYPQLLDKLTALVGTQSFSPFALAVALGVPEAQAQRLVAVAGVVAFAAIVVWGRRLGDRRAFLVALGAALLVTPILWPHYLVLLFVPIAFASLEFSGLWLAPTVLFIGTRAWSYGYVHRIVPFLLAAGFVFAVALARPRLQPLVRRVAPTAG